MENADPSPDTIAAIATPPGRGGIGVVRVSGPAAPVIAARVAGALPPPRVATLAGFRDAKGAPLDQGLALYFPAPGSYTGEHILELQGHGGPVVALDFSPTEPLLASGSWDGTVKMWNVYKKGKPSLLPSLPLSLLHILFVTRACDFVSGLTDPPSFPPFLP